MSNPERVKPDMSIAMHTEQGDYFLNRVYDHVHIFRWLGHGILKIVCETGFMQFHTSEDEALRVAEASGITPVYREEIAESEYEQYLKLVAKQLDDQEDDTPVLEIPDFLPDDFS